MALTEFGERCTGMLLLFELFSRCREFFELRVVQLRVLQVQARERIQDCRHHNQAREPLVVGRYNHLWRVLRCGVSNHFFASILIVVPAFPLANVCGQELPVLPRIFQAFQEQPLLIFLGDV